MTTLWHGNVFDVTSPLWGESTGTVKFHSQNTHDAGLDVFGDILLLLISSFVLRSFGYCNSSFTHPAEQCPITLKDYRHHFPHLYVVIFTVFSLCFRSPPTSSSLLLWTLLASTSMIDPSTRSGRPFWTQETALRRVWTWKTRMKDWFVDFSFAIFSCHDDVIKWKHFPRNWPFVRGIHPFPGEFPAQRPVTLSFDYFFDLRLNKRLSKPSLRWWWFETLSRPLCRHCNIIIHVVNCPYLFARRLSNIEYHASITRFQFYL